MYMIIIVLTLLITIFIIIANSEYCPAVWDAWTCYSKQTPDSSSEAICPYYSYFSEPPCISKYDKLNM